LWKVVVARIGNHRWARVSATEGMGAQRDEAWRQPTYLEVWTEP